MDMLDHSRHVCAIEVNHYNPPAAFINFAASLLLVCQPVIILRLKGLTRTKYLPHFHYKTAGSIHARTTRPSR